jgi:hypothetical protein
MSDVFNASQDFFVSTEDLEIIDGRKNSRGVNNGTPPMTGKYENGRTTRVS